MSSQNLIKDIHEIVLDMGKEFHKICTQNSIPYCMLGGSMLGAVRHKGFIPWDDDMDFGVERKYFAELINILQKQLPKELRLICKENTPNFYGGSVKIENHKTLVKERLSNFNYGVTIDIFPLDTTNGNLSFFSRNHIINTLYKMHNYRFHHLEGYGKLKNSISKLLHILNFPPNKEFIYKIIDNHLLRNKGEYLANHYGAWGMKEIVKKEFITEPILYDFEDTKFFGVSTPKEYLTCLYGKDYMTLPPKEKQIFHIIDLQHI